MKIQLFNFIIYVLLVITAHAEVITDGSLGQNVNLSGPNFKITSDLGQQHGGNLFHSFQDFNINLGESATFSGPNSVQNVISRVTGGNPSYINGLFRSTIPNADMYFLNPYGIMFGEGAELDVQGSFHASTADTLRLSDGGEFNVRFPNESLLTVAPVEAFGFLTDEPATIELRDSWLEVPKDETLSLIGGDLLMDGKLPSYQIEKTLYGNKVTVIFEKQYKAGRINLASISSQGEVLPTKTGLEFSQGMEGGKIILNNIEIKTPSQGNIFIRGGNFELANSKLDASTIDNKEGGLINIYTDNLTITKGAKIVSISKDTGKGGKIIIKSKNITLSSENEVGSSSEISVNSQGTGMGGDIEIETNKITVTGGAAISNITFGNGNGGNINLKVSDTLHIYGKNQTNTRLFSSIVATSQGVTDNAGNGGNIDVQAQRIILTDRGGISVATAGTGQAGSITINVDDLILTGGVVSSISRGEKSNSGNAGNITVYSDKAVFTYDGRLNTNTWGGGNGGFINLIIADTLELSLDGAILSGSLSQTLNKIAGKGGDIKIKAPKIILNSGGIISNSTRSTGMGGSILIESDKISISGKSSVWPNNSTIASSSDSSEDNAGNAGKIDIQADTIKLKDNGEISTFANQADGGNITLKTSNLLYLQKGTIATDVKGGEGNGGNIFIDEPKFTILNQGRINANTSAGTGGRVHIIAENFIGTPDSLITADATSQLGKDGIVEIEAPKTDIISGFSSLLTKYLTSETKKGCTPDKLYNKFTLKNGFRKATASKLLDNTWSSLYSDAKILQNTMIKDENILFTKLGCNLGN